jgi:L-asparaginase II
VRASPRGRVGPGRDSNPARVRTHGPRACKQMDRESTREVPEPAEAREVLEAREILEAREVLAATPAVEGSAWDGVEAVSRASESVPRAVETAPGVAGQGQGDGESAASEQPASSGGPLAFGEFAAGATAHVAEPAPLVEVWRGRLVESRHRGHVVALDGDGRVVARLGSPETVTYLRSSAKPHQAVPLVATGAADRFGFTPAELAVACGSHNGERAHVETVAGMLEKTGLGESALKCGVHEPFGREAAAELRRRGERPGVLHNNCSGKHAGMLALALHLGAPPDTYDHPEGPVQQSILRAVSRFSDVPAGEIALGTDGCGVPVFGLPVSAMALMYARLVAPPAGFDAATARACRRIIAAMTGAPEMVGGERERLDTEMMRATGGRVISKVGAEGVYTVGVLPSARWPRGLGLALKIEDGEDRRARPTVVVESLRQLGALDSAALAALAPYSRFPIRNHRGDTVGEVRARFELEAGDGG